MKESVEAYLERNGYINCQKTREIADLIYGYVEENLNEKTSIRIELPPNYDKNKLEEFKKLWKEQIGNLKHPSILSRLFDESSVIKLWAAIQRNSSEVWEYSNDMDKVISLDEIKELFNEILNLKIE